MTRLALPISALLLAACGDSTTTGDVATAPALAATAAAPNVIVETIPIANTAFNPCSGEPVEVSGSLHVVTRIWNDPGTLRIRGHANMNLAGLGLWTGIRYRLQEVTNSLYEAQFSGGIAETDQVFRLTLISAGPADNWYLTVNGSFLFYPDGSLEFFPKKFEFVCR
ncbi:MAG: hypothetical protein ACREOC_10700 [Gemmatimonadales bacterium]